MARLSVGERRGEILRAALHVIQRDGVHAATTRAIVAEAEMPLASFHYVFRSRDDMIRELIEFVVEGEGVAAEASLSDSLDIRTAVRAGLQGYFELVVAEPHREQSMFELFHYSMRTPELRDLATAQYESYHRLAEDLLVAGAERAGVRWAVPVASLARLLVTFTDGVTLAWLADRDSAAAEATLDIAADTIAGFAREPHPTKGQMQ